jgi:hypothetical protein
MAKYLTEHQARKIIRNQRFVILFLFIAFICNLGINYLILNILLKTL